jgi:thiol-disulfide isomerase/thioredoxin
VKKLLIVATMLGLVACSSLNGTSTPIVGTPGAKVATDFTVDLIGGGTFTLSKVLRDKPVVLNFWASWCPPCRQEMPDLDAVARATPGVQFIGIAVDDVASNATAYAAQIGVSYPIAVDEDYTVNDAYAVQYLPQTWIIDRNGTVTRSVVRAVTAEELTAWIAPDLGVTSEG